MTCDLAELRRRQGVVFDLKRFAVHDGPGIRTTVFVKGCNMTCWWCHNPESRRSAAELFFVETKCRHCGRCVAVCPVGAHRMVSEGGKVLHEVDHSKCVVCGKCAAECAVEAVKIVGTVRTAGEVLDEVLEDRHFYEASEGGMTISGGEPLMQVEFVCALLMLAKSEGLNTALDTNGNHARAKYEKVLPVVDLFLFDLKQMDAETHERVTGGKLETVLGNLRWLSEQGAKILVRCPVIPAANAEDDGHWRKVAEVAKKLTGVIGVEYLPYHRLWVSKSSGVGLAVGEEEKELKEVSPERIEAIREMLAASGKMVGKG